MDKCCPALVPYLGARAKADGELVLFMELHPGTTLYDFRVKLMGSHLTDPIWESEFSYPGWDGLPSGSLCYKPATMPWDLKQQITREVVEALAQLQAANLVHRDLQPKNIILTIKEDASKHSGYHVQVGKGRDSGCAALEQQLINEVAVLPKARQDPAGGHVIAILLPTPTAPDAEPGCVPFALYQAVPAAALSLFSLCLSTTPRGPSCWTWRVWRRRGRTRPHLGWCHGTLSCTLHQRSSL
jgi:serine/threonine protein kinase